MLITRSLKLQSPLLAAKMTGKKTPKGEPIREFVRIKSELPGAHIESQLPRWNWAFLEARDALTLGDVSTAAILPSRFYTVPRTSTYNRSFRRGTTKVTEVFESLPSGQVVQMGFTLSRHLPPGGDSGGRFTRPPDEEEFDAMLTHIGEHLGMSEWGHAYLYGRFTIKK